MAKRPSSGGSGNNTTSGTGTGSRDPDDRVNAYVRQAMPGAAEVDPSALKFDPLEEIGVSGLKIYSGYLQEEYLPELRGPNAIKVFRNMSEGDPIVRAVLTAIELILRATEWRWAPADDSKEAEKMADFVKSIFEDCSHTWEDFLAEALSFLVYGWSYFEIVYKKRDGDHKDDLTRHSKFDDGKIGIRKLAIRSQDSLLRWEIADDGEIKGMWQIPPLGGGLILIPLEKALLFRTTSKKDSPEGFSILRSAYRSWYFLKTIEDLEAIGIERELCGLPVGYIPARCLRADASTADKALLSQMQSIVRDMKLNQQSGVVLPSDHFPDANSAPSAVPIVKVELMRSAGERTINTDPIVRRHQQNIARSALADFIMLGDQKGSYALSQNKSELFLRACETYLNQVASVINRFLIPRLWELNQLDMDLMPKAQPGRVAPTDLATLGAFLQQLAAAGMPLFPDEKLQDYLREIGGMPEQDIVEGYDMGPGGTPNWENPAEGPDNMGAYSSESGQESGYGAGGVADLAAEGFAPYSTPTAQKRVIVNGHTGMDGFDLSVARKAVKKLVRKEMDKRGITKDWEESKHPRDHGRFSSGGGHDEPQTPPPTSSHMDKVREFLSNETGSVALAVGHALTYSGLGVGIHTALESTAIPIVHAALDYALIKLGIPVPAALAVSVASYAVLHTARKLGLTEANSAKMLRGVGAELRNRWHSSDAPALRPGGWETALKAIDSLELALNQFLLGLDRSGHIHKADETPALRSLCVTRPILNAKVIRQWALDQGVPSTVPADDMHVTIAFSRKPVDWSTLTPDSTHLTIPSSGDRGYAMFGVNEDTLVLTFDDPRLDARHSLFDAIGASYDWEYQPHISLTYLAPGDTLYETMIPYPGPIVLGGENYKEVSDDWDEIEARRAKLPVSKHNYVFAVAKTGWTDEAREAAKRAHEARFSGQKNHPAAAKYKRLSENPAWTYGGAKETYAVHAGGQHLGYVTRVPGTQNHITEGGGRSADTWSSHDLQGNKLDRWHPSKQAAGNGLVQRVAEFGKLDTPGVEIWIARHGCTELNASGSEGSEDRLRGWSDVPMTEEGKQQVEQLAHELTHSGIEILFSSDFERAADTAKAIAATTGAQVVISEDMRPWNVGDLTGTSSVKAIPQLQEYAREKPDEPIPGGESFNTFKQRVFEGLEQALELAGGRCLSLVTHHRVERLIAAWIAAGMPDDHSVDLGTMFQTGEDCGTAHKVRIDPSRVEPDRNLSGVIKLNGADAARV
jgi:broad specificity phosphatase PhoE